MLISLLFISVEDVEFHFNLLDEVNIMSDQSIFLPRPVEFEVVPDRIFAEQLTYMDVVRAYFIQHLKP